MSQYREIITRAVIGKGKKFIQATHQLTPNVESDCILGCWIINHAYDAKKCGDFVEVYGTYDINLWLATEDNTKTLALTEAVAYTDAVRIKYTGDDLVSDQFDVIVRVIQHPNCLEARICPTTGEIIVTVEREFLIEVIGECKLCVQTFPCSVVDDVETVFERICDNQVDTTEITSEITSEVICKESKHHKLDKDLANLDASFIGDGPKS
ncbi:MAG: outer spore coat protein CotE [Bacilli bacterium]